MYGTLDGKPGNLNNLMEHYAASVDQNNPRHNEALDQGGSRNPYAAPRNPAQDQPVSPVPPPAPTPPPGQNPQHRPMVAPQTQYRQRSKGSGLTIPVTRTGPAAGPGLRSGPPGSGINIPG